MAIPKPEPRDWQIANAQVLQVTDREVLSILRNAKKNVDKLLAELPAGKSELRRAQLEHSRAKLLAEQATLFERLGDVVSARRAAAAARSARLSAASDAALLRAVGKGAQAQFLYDSALEVSQRAIDTALARLKLSALPLSNRIYNTSVWMGGRLSRMISETMAAGLDAGTFAKKARDWFNPSTPGGVRFAAMRLARTEINNAFHAMSAQKYAETPWVTEVDWNLSKSHPKKDICNEVHADSPFLKDKVPARPHPQCMCYITPRTVEEDEFIDNFLRGDYDDFLDAELEANGWEVKDQTPTPNPVAKPKNAGKEVGSVASLLPDQRTALYAESARERQQGSNNLYDMFSYGNLFDRKERGIDRKPAVREYFADSSRINTALRTGEITPEVQEVVAAVDAAMDLTTNKDPFVVFRGVRGDLISGKSVGDTVTDSIYWSTALDPQQAKKFARTEGSVLLQIELPKGTHMIAENATETEVLLPRGTTILINRIDGENVFATLVPQKNKKDLAVTVLPAAPVTGSKAAGSHAQLPEKLVTVPTPTPEPVIVPKIAGDGYSPGNWQQDVSGDNEAKILEIMQEFRVFKKNATDEELRKLATGLVEDTTGENDITFRNGPHEVVFRGKLSPEQQQKFLAHVDTMQSKFPAGRDMAIRVDSSSEFEGGVGGETTLATGYMRINEKVLQQDFWPGMPVSSKVPSALYVLAHEWGHAFPDKNAARNTHVHHDAVAAGGMSRYGTKGGDNAEGHAAEGYAEAFAEWSLTNGKTTNKAAQEYAKRFGWGERFGS